MNEHLILWLFPLSWFIIWLAMNKVYRAIWVAFLAGAIVALMYAFVGREFEAIFVWISVGLLLIAIYPFVRDVRHTKAKDREEALEKPGAGIQPWVSPITKKGDK